MKHYFIKRIIPLNWSFCIKSLLTYWICLNQGAPGIPFKAHTIFMQMFSRRQSFLHRWWWITLESLTVIIISHPWLFPGGECWPTLIFDTWCQTVELNPKFSSSRTKDVAGELCFSEDKMWKDVAGESCSSGDGYVYWHWMSCSILWKPHSTWAAILGTQALPYMYTSGHPSQELWCRCIINFGKEIT